jgi:hypothetical protein
LLQNEVSLAMRMTEDDARARREHAGKSGSATEYDALHGPGLYGRKPSAALRALVQQMLGRAQSSEPSPKKPGTPHIW